MDADINLGHQGGVAVVTVFVLDYLKKANWFPFISENTETLNRIISLAVAVGTAAGLKVLSGDSAHGWTISIPPLAVMADTLIHAATQFGGQELLHKLLGNHELSKQMNDKITQLQQMLTAFQAAQGGLNKP